MPGGRPIFSTRCMMMKTAFATTASVSAICNPTRIAPVLLRSIALRMGRISMPSSYLLCLQVRSRLHAAHAPRGVKAGEQTRQDSDADRSQQHGNVQSSQLVVVLVEVAH